MSHICLVKHYLDKPEPISADTYNLNLYGVANSSNFPARGLLCAFPSLTYKVAD